MTGAVVIPLPVEGATKPHDSNDALLALADAQSKAANQAVGGWVARTLLKFSKANLRAAKFGTAHPEDKTMAAQREAMANMQADAERDAVVFAELVELAQQAGGAS
jgi:hypothetical protein